MYFTEIDDGKAFAIKCAGGKFDWRKKIVLYEAKVKQEQQNLAQRYDNAATKFVDDLQKDGIELSAFLKYRELFDNFNSEVIAKIYRAATDKGKK